MNELLLELDAALASYVPTAKDVQIVAQAKDERERFVSKFPMDSLDKLTPETYCIGRGDRENLCWWVERGTNALSRYTPGSSKSYGMYWEKRSSTYRMVSVLAGYHESHPKMDEGEVLMEMIAKPLKQVVKKHGDDATLQVIQGVGKGFLLKLLILYYPDEFLEVNSPAWIDRIIDAYGLEKPESLIERNKVLRRFYEEKKKLVKGGDLPQQAFIGVIARQLGIVQPRFWHMQLHPGSNSSFSREDVLKILKQYGVVGMGEAWDNDGGQPRQFAEDMHEGDVIGIREGGFVALVRVTGPCRKNKKQDELNWFHIVRPIEIISEDAAEYIEKYKAETGNGPHENLFCSATLSEITTRCKNKFVQFWYRSVM